MSTQNPSQRMSTPPLHPNSPNPKTTISFQRIVFFVILGLIVWTAFFAVLFLWHPWAKQNITSQTVGNKQPTSTSLSLNPTTAKQQVTYNAQIAGIQNNKLVIFNPDTNQITDTGISLQPNWTYRLSPDKKKIFISTLQIDPEHQGATFYIYDMQGNKLYEHTPTFDKGYEKVGTQQSTGFGQNYFAWDENSQGILYFTSGLINVHVDTAGEYDNFQFRYINLADKTDKAIYQEQKEYFQEEHILLGYNKQNGYVIMGDVPDGGTWTQLYTINVSNKQETQLVKIATRSIPLWRTISPDSLAITGIVPNETGYANPGTFHLLTFVPSIQDHILSPLVNLPATLLTPSNEHTAFFVNNDTIAFIAIDQKTYGSGNNKVFSNIPTTLYLITRNTKTISQTISLADLFLLKNDTNIQQEDIRDAMRG